jgi:excisionase family DNA binding protein
MGRSPVDRNYTRVIMSDESRPSCFTVSEAAQYLRISRALLYQLIRSGRIRTVKIGTRTIVRGAELGRFLDQQQAA